MIAETVTTRQSGQWLQVAFDGSPPLNINMSQWVPDSGCGRRSSDDGAHSNGAAEAITENKIGTAYDETAYMQASVSLLKTFSAF